MTGKRPRLMMRRTVSMAALGAGSDAPKQPDHVPHQVIGFAPKAFSDNGTTNNGSSSMPVEEEDSDAAAAAPVTAKSRPFSGLSSLADTKDAATASICSGEKVGLGILAALDKDPCCSPPGTIIRSMAHPSSPAAAAAHPSFKPGCFPEAMSICNNKGQQQQARQFDFVFQANSGHRKSDRCSSRTTTTLEFLESCYLCKRDISYGRDIYMYRGDRAFCSVECRHQQIVNDERVERRDKCSSAALKKMGAGVNQQPRHVNQRAKVTQATTAAAA